MGLPQKTERNGYNDEKYADVTSTGGVLFNFPMPQNNLLYIVNNISCAIFAVGEVNKNILSGARPAVDLFYYHVQKQFGKDISFGFENNQIITKPKVSINEYIKEYSFSWNWSFDEDYRKAFNI